MSAREQYHAPPRLQHPIDFISPGVKIVAQGLLKHHVRQSKFSHAVIESRG